MVVARFLMKSDAVEMVFNECKKKSSRFLVYEKGLDGRWHVLDLG